MPPFGLYFQCFCVFRLWKFCICFRCLSKNIRLKFSTYMFLLSSLVFFLAQVCKMILKTRLQLLHKMLHHFGIMPFAPASLQLQVWILYISWKALDKLELAFRFAVFEYNFFHRRTCCVIRVPKIMVRFSHGIETGYGSILIKLPIIFD